jgi:hypothetical protein
LKNIVKIAIQIKEFGCNMKYIKSRKDLYLFIFALVFCFLIAEIVAIQVVDLYRWPEGVLRTYSALYEKTHHLREMDSQKWDYVENADELIFTVVRSFEGKRRKLLVQGDSWGEQVTQSAFSRAVVEHFAETNDWGVVNAGTTSYSASPMTMQFRILTGEYGLDPSDVLVFFDQTDLGDELCRYESRRLVGSDGELSAVLPEPLTSAEVYAVSRVLKSQDILAREYLPSMVRWGWYAAEKRIRRYSLDERRCGWADITRPLISGISNDEFDYIVSVFQDYFETVLSNPSTRNLVIAVHPHKSHLLTDGSYVYGIEEVVTAAVTKSKHKENIEVFEGKKIYDNYLSDIEIEEMFMQEDCSCHLTDEAHSKYLERLLFDAVLPSPQ